MGEYHSLTLEPLLRVAGSVTIPGSKSITNRALLLAALAHGTTILHNVLVSEDSETMLNALSTLGIGWQQLDPCTIQVTGLGGLPCLTGEYELYLANAGTVYRPLVALLAFNQGNATFTFRGHPRLHERPIASLVTSLQQLGVKITYLEKDGYAPLQIQTVKANVKYIQNNDGDAITRLADSNRVDNLVTFASSFMDGIQFGSGVTCCYTENDVTSEIPELCISVAVNESSQFLTALLMVAPLLGVRVRIQLLTNLVSQPYIALTIQMMKQFGVLVVSDGNDFIIAPQQYLAQQSYHIESDASSASYFYLAGAIAGPLEIKGCTANSMQGDAKFVQILQQIGATITSSDTAITISPGQQSSEAPDGNYVAFHPINGNFNALPDAAMGLCIAALFTPVGSVNRLTGLETWKLKETDRLRAMYNELTKLGVTCRIDDESIEIVSPEKLHDAVIETYNDHRMAMCFALCSLHHSKPLITIKDPLCTAKTFPNYFELLSKIGITYDK